ncbi:MAG: hypothetical protein M3R17_10185 [Bacteroidota bacterium]|nr:hypothetical protein [Bacteroidota bacterium]
MTSGAFLTDFWTGFVGTAGLDAFLAGAAFLATGFEGFLGAGLLLTAVFTAFLAAAGFCGLFLTGFLEFFLLI